MKEKHESMKKSYFIIIILLTIACLAACKDSKVTSAPTNAPADITSTPVVTPEEGTPAPTPKTEVITYYKQDGTLDYSNKITYGNNGLPAFEEISGADGALKYSYEYVYDDNNKVVKSTCYLPDKSVWFGHSYEYNSNGETVKDECYDGENISYSIEYLEDADQTILTNYKINEYCVQDSFAYTYSGKIPFEVEADPESRNGSYRLTSGTCIKKTEHYPECDYVREEIEYEYSVDGNLIRKYECSEDTTPHGNAWYSDFKSKEEFYGSNGEISKRIIHDIFLYEYSGDGGDNPASREYRETWTETYYNSNGDIILYKDLINNNNLSYEYSFDEKAQKAEIKTYKNGILYSITEQAFYDGKLSDEYENTDYYDENGVLIRRVEATTEYSVWFEYYKNGNVKERSSDGSKAEYYEDGRIKSKTSFAYEGDSEEVYSSYLVLFFYDNSNELCQIKYARNDIPNFAVNGVNGGEYFISAVIDCKKDETKVDTYIKVKETVYNLNGDILEWTEYKSNGEWSRFSGTNQLIEKGTGDPAYFIPEEYSCVYDSKRYYTFESDLTLITDNPIKNEEISCYYDASSNSYEIDYYHNYINEGGPDKKVWITDYYQNGMPVKTVKYVDDVEETTLYREDGTRLKTITSDKTYDFYEAEINYRTDNQIDNYYCSCGVYLAGIYNPPLNITTINEQFLYDENGFLIQVNREYTDNKNDRVVLACIKDETKPNTYIAVKETWYDSDGNITSVYVFDRNKKEYIVYNQSGDVVKSGDLSSQYFSDFYSYDDELEALIVNTDRRYIGYSPSADMSFQTVLYFILKDFWF